jgi:hypothetical protein
MGTANCEAVHQMLLNCGFHDAPARTKGRWSVVAPPVDRGDSEVVVGCVVEPTGEFYLRVSPAGARDWLHDVLMLQDGARVPMRAAPEPYRYLPSSSWIAITVGIGAMALFAWTLFGP